MQNITPREYGELLEAMQTIRRIARAGVDRCQDDCFSISESDGVFIPLLNAVTKAALQLAEINLEEHKCR